MSAQTTEPVATTFEPSRIVSLLSTHIYRGPNTLSRHPVIAITLRLAPMDDPRWASLALPGDVQAIVPSFGAPVPSTLAQWVLDLVLALQRTATGDDQQGTNEGRVEDSCEGDVVRLIVGYDDEHVGLSTAKLAIRIAQRLWNDSSPFDLRAAMDDIVTVAHDAALEPSTRLLVDEATVRGISHVELDGRSLVQLGQGVYQRRIRGPVTSLTSSLGVHTAADEQLTAGLLRAVGLPAQPQLVGREYRLLVVGESVVAIAERLPIRGTTIDRTLDAHSDHIDAAREAARVVGLDVAGIDMILPDITQAARQAGGIVGIDGAPDLTMHTHPTVGDPQDVAKPIMDLLFPPGARRRPPIVAVTGTNGKTTTTRMIGHILKTTGRHVGMTSTDGIFIDQHRMASYDAAGPQSARMVLKNPTVDFALFEVARGGILREGLGYEHNDVAVVLNVTADHLGLGGVETLEQLAAVKRVIVEAVPSDGTAVLNADDSLVVAMEPFCKGSTMYFTMNARSGVVDAHCARGGRAAVLEPTEAGDTIVFRHGGRRTHVLRADQIRAAFGGRARMNVQNALAAASAALAAGASLDDIRHGLRTFDTSYALAPGRLNVTELEGATVVIDYAHNAVAMSRLGDFVDRLAASRALAPRRFAVIATPGDRRVEDLRRNGVAAAWHFDTLVIHENRARGKRPGETARIVEQGVREAMAAGARCSAVEVVLDMVDACERVLSMLQLADIAVLCVDRADVAWNLVEQHRGAVRSMGKEGGSSAEDAGRSVS